MIMRIIAFKKNMFIFFLTHSSRECNFCNLSCSIHETVNLLNKIELSPNSVFLSPQMQSVREAKYGAWEGNFAETVPYDEVTT
jgi:hypothetical protein